MSIKDNLNFIEIESLERSIFSSIIDIEKDFPKDIIPLWTDLLVLYNKCLATEFDKEMHFSIYYSFINRLEAAGLHVG